MAFLRTFEIHLPILFAGGWVLSAQKGSSLFFNNKPLKHEKLNFLHNIRNLFLFIFALSDNLKFLSKKTDGSKGET